MGFFAINSKPVAATHNNSGHCGNGVCQASQSETCNTCSADCGACSVPTPTPPPVSQPTPTPVIAAPTNPPSNPTQTTTATTAPGQPTATTVPGQPASANAPAGSNSTSPSSNEPSGTNTFYPNISLTSIPQSPTNDTTLFFSGNTSITSGSIAQVEYSLDNGSSWVNTNRSGNSFSFTTQSLREGAYAIKVRAKSSAGTYTQAANYAQANILIATTPPKLLLNAFSENPSKNQTPLISGSVNSAFAQIRNVEITTDGGITWSDASFTNGRFQFQTKKLEDNNYNVRTRAADTAGNIGQSDEKILIIDTIPPVIGGTMIAIGPQVLSPDKDGIIRIVAGSKITLTLSMRGGTTAATVLSDMSEFKLKQIPGTHLWSSTLNFENEGLKSISISAIDGANNRTTRNLQKIIVENFGIVTDKKRNDTIENAHVSLYFYDQQSKLWVLWQAESYGQKNPQTTDTDGYYSFMAPPGKYYLETRSPLFRTSQTKILDLKETTILNSNFLLNPSPTLLLDIPIIGKLNLSNPFIPPDTQDTKSGDQSDNVSVSQLVKESLPIGSIMPEFSLPDRNNKQVTSQSLRGKKLLLTFFAPWSDPSKEQLRSLSELTKELNPSNETMLGINLQDSIAVTDIFMRRGGYSFPVVADRNGDTASTFRIAVLPQHVIIDKDGVVRSVHTGVLGKKDLLEKLKTTE